MLIVAAAAALACPQRARSKSPQEYRTVAGGVRYHASSSIDPGNGDCRTTFAGRGVAHEVQRVHGNSVPRWLWPPTIWPQPAERISPAVCWMGGRAALPGR